MIPRIIHRVWLDDPMPDEFASYGARWADLHPDWTLIDWRHDADLPPLINQPLYDQAETLCPRDWKRFRSDLVRLELLHLYGGVYADCDVEPLKPLDPLLDHPAWIAWSPNRGPNGERVLTQAIMAAEPGNRWIMNCIYRAPEAVERHRGKPLAQVIGPWHVTRVWRDNTHAVTVLPERTFHPQSIRDRDRGRPVDLDGCYGWHRWCNTRDNRKGGVG